MIQKDEKEINKNIEEKTFFHLFKVDINELWSYYIQPSFITAYFQEKCKITNIKKINKTLKENDILDLYYQRENVNVKLLIDKIIDTENYKSVILKLIEYPDDVSPFIVITSFYFCSYTRNTGMRIETIVFDKTKKNFILGYIYENEETIYKNIEKYIEINFKETEQTESILINKNGSEVFDFLTTKNYTNLKILLGNNAEIKPTNNPNEIEIEHFTKKNKAKFIINKDLDFNEKELVIQPIESIIPIPRQIIIIKIINFNKDDCLVMFTHKIKEYIRNDSINNYSLLKKKFLWLLKSTIEK